MVQTRRAGVGSALPASSVALARKTCRPSERPVCLSGEVQALRAEPSREHPNVEPSSVEENSKVAESLLTVPDGPETTSDSGGVVSAAAKTKSPVTPLKDCLVEVTSLTLGSWIFIRQLCLTP